MSELWKLGQSDFVKGALLTMITAIVNMLYQVLQSDGVIDYKQVGTVALTALVAYLMKNLSTDANGNILGKVQP